MKKTWIGLALATLAFTAQALAPNYGSYAGTTGGSRSGGEGSFSAMANTPAYYKYAYAWAQAGLGDGTLHAASSAISCPPCRTHTGAQSVARYWDTVTFSNGQNLGLAQLSVSIDGTLTPGGFAQASARFYVGYAHADFFDRLDVYAPSVALKSGTTVLGDDLAIPLGNTQVFIFAELYTAASTSYHMPGQQTSADFGNTLHFNWVLPEGVTTSSASGQFMTSAVPEPGSALLLACGLGGLGLLKLRRRGGVQ